jgi:ribosomal protein L11 methyltransferase
VLKLSPVIKNLHRWTRLSSEKWEDSWTERLRFLGPERVVFITWPDSRALKIEAYCDEATAKKLIKSFGGRSTKVAPHVWSGDPEKPRGPLSIRSALKVFLDEESWKAHQDKGNKPPGIFIPAGMAFGTGEHATTATCLRLLSDLVPELPEKFAALDLGTGSGILAIGAAALGAGEVKATDYDPAAVRITKQNAAKNRTRNVKAEQSDVLEFADKNLYQVVLANLFSETLMAASPRIARSMKANGWLIFSGVLRKQAEEVAATFVKQGFTPARIVARGKWCAGICQKTATVKAPKKTTSRS